jgi:hypothetical protein
MFAFLHLKYQYPLYGMLNTFSLQLKRRKKYVNWRTLTALLINLPTLHISILRKKYFTSHFLFKAVEDLP